MRTDHKKGDTAYGDLIDPRTSNGIRKYMCLLRSYGKMDFRFETGVPENPGNHL